MSAEASGARRIRKRSALAEQARRKSRNQAERRLLDGLASGVPLLRLCREAGMPDRLTVLRWAEEDEELGRALARARRAGFEAIAEEALLIADDASADHVEKARASGAAYTAFDSEHVQRSKLRIDTRLKLLAKWDPGRYGERIDVTSAGERLRPPSSTLAIQAAALLQGVRKRLEGSDASRAVPHPGEGREPAAFPEPAAQLEGKLGFGLRENDGEGPDGDPDEEDDE